MAIHPSATIHPGAKLHESVSVGPGAVILEGCDIGPDCEIMAGAVIGPHVVMGARNRVHFFAIIGHDPQFLGFDRSTLSGVLIGNDNEFREHCSIHRGLKPGANTTIGNNNFIMGYTHIGHDCQLGNHIVMANNTSLAGHVSVEDRAFLSGHSAVHQFARIGRIVMMGGMSGIPKDVPPFCTTRGEFGFLTGINVIGMRRAGITAQARTAVKSAFRHLFRSGKSLSAAIAELRAEWQAAGGPPAPEAQELVDFCATPSKRGILAARSMYKRLDETGEDDGEDSDEES